MDDLVSQSLPLIKGVWKYRWFAMLVAWIVAIAGWIAVMQLPDHYQSSARVFVDTQSILKPLLSGMTTIPNVDEQVSIMSRTLLSRPNVERVVRMVDLDLKTNSARDRERQIDELISRIKIAGTVQNDIYTISYTGDNPKTVKDVVQALLTIFVEGSIGNKKNDSAHAVQFIDDQIKVYEGKLTAAENALKEFKLKNMGMLPRQGSDYGAKLMETSDALSQAKLDLAEAEQARDAIKKQIYGDSVTSSKSVATPADPELDARIQALNKNLDQLRLQYTEQHPDIVSTKRLIAQLEQRKLDRAKHPVVSSDPGLNASPMLQQLKVSLSGAEAHVASMRARVQEYTLRMAKLKEMSVAGPEIETELAQLNRDYQINKENYEKLVASREAAKLSGELTATSDMMTFRVIDPPTTPLSPTSPHRPLLMSVVFIGALAAGIGFSLLMNMLRPTFMTIHSLQEETGLPVLGSVSMTWAPGQIARQRHSIYVLSASLLSLAIIYGGILARALLKS